VDVLRKEKQGLAVECGLLRSKVNALNAQIAHLTEGYDFSVGAYQPAARRLMLEKVLHRHGGGADLTKLVEGWDEKNGNAADMVKELVTIGLMWMQTIYSNGKCYKMYGLSPAGFLVIKHGNTAWTYGGS